MLSITGRTLPVVLALLSIGVLQTQIVQRDFFRYLFVANLQCMCRNDFAHHIRIED